MLNLLAKPGDKFENFRTAAVLPFEVWMDAYNPETEKEPQLIHLYRARDHDGLCILRGLASFALYQPLEQFISRFQGMPMFQHYASESASENLLSLVMHMSCAYGEHMDAYLRVARLLVDCGAIDLNLFDDELIKFLPFTAAIELWSDFASGARARAGARPRDW